MAETEAGPEREAEELPPDMQGGDAGPLTTPRVLGTDDGFIAMSKRLPEIAKAKDAFRKFALTRAYKGDWMQFGDKLELGGPGAGRVASDLGVSFTNWKSWKEEGEDRKGKWFRWYYTCTASFCGRILEGCMGRGDSRQKFYFIDSGQEKDIEDISEGEIRISAWRSSMKEGTKQMFGLRSIPADGCEALGLDPSKIKKISFDGSGSKDASGNTTGEKLEIKAKVVSVGSKTIGDNKKTKFVIGIEGSEFKTVETFSESLAKAASGMKGKDAKLTIQKKGRWAPMLLSIEISTGVGE